MNEMKNVAEEWFNFIDNLEKAKKDLTRLVPTQKQVSRGGKTYMTTVYVSPGEAKNNETAEKTSAVEVQKHLRPIRKTLGTDRYKEYLKACGVSWEENKENAGADTMRASSAAKKFLEGGGQLNTELYEHMKNGGAVADFKKDEPKLVVETPKTEPKPDVPKPKTEPKPVVEAPKPEPKPEAPKQPKPWEKIRDAKSQKEISDILKKTYSMNHVELEKLDLETAKMTGLEVDRMMKKFPAMKKSSLRNFGTHKEVRKEVIEQVGSMWGVQFGKTMGNKIRMTKNTFAYHITWGGTKMPQHANGIHLGNHIFAKENVKEGTERIKGLHEKGWFSTGTLRGLVVHEIGHAVHKAYDAELSPKLRAIMKKQNIKDIEQGLSRYGKTQFVEFVAEAFAEYYTSPNPRPIAKEVGAVFEEIAVVKYNKK